MGGRDGLGLRERQERGREERKGGKRCRKSSWWEGVGDPGWVGGRRRWGRGRRKGARRAWQRAADRRKSGRG